MIYAVMDGNQTYQWGDSAIAAVVAILMVFLILGAIILITHLVFKALGYIDLKKEIDAAKKPAKVEEIAAKPTQFNQNDEDMVAAVLVATIDYQNEIKQCFIILCCINYPFTIIERLDTPYFHIFICYKLIISYFVFHISYFILSYFTKYNKRKTY